MMRGLVVCWAQDFADFAGQALQGEGFLQECFLAVGGEWAGECVLRVAGEIQNFDAGTCGLELRGEFVTAEAGHDDVCDDEVNGVGVAGGEGESGIAVLRFKDAIAARFKSFTDELPDGIFIFDQQNGF